MPHELSALEIERVIQSLPKNVPQLAYSWDNQAAPDYYHGDDEGWRWNELRRHQMWVLSDRPGAYREWLAVEGPRHWKHPH